MVAAILCFVSGLGLGWMIAQAVAKEWWSAQVEDLTRELRFAKAKARVLESDLEKARQRDSEWAKEKVKKIRSLAKLKESGWDLPQVRESEE